MERTACMCNWLQNGDREVRKTRGRPSRKKYEHGKEKEGRIVRSCAKNTFIFFGIREWTRHLLHSCIWDIWQMCSCLLRLFEDGRMDRGINYPGDFSSETNCEVMRFAAYSVASEAFVANGHTFIAQCRCLLWRNWLRKRYLVRSIGAERKMARNRNALFPSRDEQLDNFWTKSISHSRRYLVWTTDVHSCLNILKADVEITFILQ